jgi:protein-S-isoprenylcysteine O-methyltransferase Ste14
VKTLIAAYVVIAVFIVAERRLRSGEEARTMEEQPADRGTTRQVGAAFGFALTAGLAAPLLSKIGIGRLPKRLAKVGLCFMVAGLGLRVWSAQTLGRFYTRTLRVAEDQQVVREGPYRWVRHPGYAADLVMWLGFGLASRNALVGGSIVLVMLTAYVRRIAAEEAMLAVHLGGAYRDYMRETSRLLPRVY